MSYIVRYNKDNTTDFEAVSFNIIQKTDDTAVNSLQLTIMTLSGDSAQTDEMLIKADGGEINVQYLQIFKPDDLETPIYESSYWNKIESIYITYNDAMAKLQANLIFTNETTAE